MQNGNYYSDSSLTFDIRLNDPALDDFIPNSYIFSVSQDNKNPLSGFDSKGKGNYKYYYIRNYSGNINITATNQIQTNPTKSALPGNKKVYYAVIGSGANILDTSGNIIDPKYNVNKVYACGSSGQIYPISPAEITIGNNNTLKFTGLKNIDLGSTDSGVTNLELVPKRGTIKTLDNSQPTKTANPYTMTNSSNVKSAVYTSDLTFSGIGAPPTDNNNYGEYRDKSNINVTKSTEVKFADGSTYKHSGGKYKTDNNTKIPQNGEPNGLLLYFSTTSVGGSGGAS
jgi:hypothetical protein